MGALNEGKACDAIIRHFERRHGAPAVNLRSPENDRDVAREAKVELTFTIRDVLIAVEHTLIEPYAGQIAGNQRFRSFMEPIAAGLVHPADCETMLESSFARMRSSNEDVERCERSRLRCWGGSTRKLLSVCQL